MRLIYVALGWVAGVVLAANNDTGSALAAALWLGLVGLALLALWLARADAALRWALVALVAFTLGGLRMALVPVTSDVARYNNIGGLTLAGLVTAEPVVRGDRVLLRVEAGAVTRAGQTVPTAGLVLAEAPLRSAVRYGDRVAVTGSLVAPAVFDTFSYADYLARGGVFSVMPGAAVEVLASGLGSPLYAGLLDAKARAARSIAANLPEPQAGLLAGILLGDESGIAPELRDDFAAVGASHIIAISGFNMVILSGVMQSLLRRARVPRGWAAAAGIVAILVYTALVGAQAAVLRAALMSGLLVAAGALRRRSFVPASLALVVLALSLFNPTVLWDVGFQLSLFATLGLALYADPLAARLNALLARLLPGRLANTAAGFLAEPLVITLAVQVMTLPLAALYFGRLSLVLLLVNLLIVPAQAALLLLGAAAVLVAAVVPVAGQLLYWYDLVLLGWTTSVVRAFAALPFADVAVLLDPRLVALYLALLIGVALMEASQPEWALRLARLLRSRPVAAASAAAVVMTLILLGALLAARPDGQLHVWLLDVGHSNAVLVQTPGGAHMLIDGGRYPARLLAAIGDRLPFNDRTLEVLVITQPDEFEYGALSTVLSRYEVGVVLTNGQPNLSESYQALRQALSAYPVVEARAGYRLVIDDGTLVEVLHPQARPSLADSLNDSALTLRLIYGEVSFLLTSDLSQEGQTLLLDGGQWPLATVLQLPRHAGARSLDRAFLAAVQPQAAVVHSDPTNRLGDPDFDTLALLADTPVFRTAGRGPLHLWTDGRTLWIL